MKKKEVRLEEGCGESRDGYVIFEADDEQQQYTPIFLLHINITLSYIVKVISLTVKEDCKRLLWKCGDSSICKRLEESSCGICRPDCTIS